MFYVSAPTLGFETARPRSRRDLFLFTLLGYQGSAADELDEAFDGVITVPGLRAKAARFDRHDALGRHLAAGNFPEPCAYVVRKRGRALGIEAKLHRGRHFVDVLTAGAARSDEFQVDLPIVQLDFVGYRNHLINQESSH